MKKYFLSSLSFIFVSALSLSAFMPVAAHAATFQVSGWLPYWRAASSTTDVLPHLNKMTEINPFGYTVKNDGTLYDEANLNSSTSTYEKLIISSRTQGVQVIPTVMWSNTNAIDTVLSSTTLRAANVASIISTVKANNWDGIDIDYEGKKASDEAYFSAFLQQLYTAMHTMPNKIVECTIEARTPPQDLNTTTPISQFQYANDLTAINNYCDQVSIMTYDQESADKTLNAAAGNSLYMPIADPKWDTAVIQLMEKSIAPSKIQLGIATYGYEYDATPYANHTGYMYNMLWAFDPGYATQLENQFHVTPTRDAAGELAFTYTPTTTPATLPTGASSATATNANTLSAAALASTNMPLSGTIRYVTWSDSVAIAQKIALAKQLGLGGVAIFKLDGGEDQNMWNILPTK